MLPRIALTVAVVLVIRGRRAALMITFLPFALVFSICIRGVKRALETCFEHRLPEQKDQTESFEGTPYESKTAGATEQKRDECSLTKREKCVSEAYIFESSAKDRAGLMGSRGPYRDCECPAMQRLHPAGGGHAQLPEECKKQKYRMGTWAPSARREA